MAYKKGNTRKNIFYEKILQPAQQKKKYGDCNERVIRDPQKNVTFSSLRSF